MHRPRRPRGLVVAPAMAVTVAAAMTLSGQITARASTSAATTDDIPGLARTLTASTAVGFPTGQHIATNMSYQAPEFPRDAEGASAKSVTRSHSIRPSGTTAALSAAAGTLGQPPVVASTPVSAVKPGLNRTFHALDLFDQRYANGGNQFTVEPPDQALCVGNGYVFEAVNSVLQVYKKSGTPASAVTDLNSFYGYPAQFNRTTGKQGPFVTDPVCLYDHATERFFLTVLTLEVNATTGELTGANHLDTAVSRTANPLDGYKIYRLPVQNDGTQGTPRHKGCPCIGDYPHIGADANALVLTTNEYPFSNDPGVFGNNFNGAQIYAFDKVALANGASSVRGVMFQNTFLPSSTGKIPGMTVWPTQSPDTSFDFSNNGTEHFLSSIAADEANPEGSVARGYANRIGVWAITNTKSLRTSSPSVHLQRSLLGSNVYGVPPYVTQKPGPVPLRDCLVVDCLGLGQTFPTLVEGPLNANDSRMQQTWYADGKVYGALDTIVQVSGNIHAGIAYYVVNAGSSTATSTMANQGYLATAGNNVTYPALATLFNGDGVMAFTLVGSGYYPSAAYAKFSAAGGPGVINVAAAGLGPQDGFTEYPIFSNRPRWGDYGAAVTDQGQIWIASEYIGQVCSFSRYVKDTTCGGTRATLGNWGTRISSVTP
jgi:hypothetical protein